MQLEKSLQDNGLKRYYWALSYLLNLLTCEPEFLGVYVYRLMIRIDKLMHIEVLCLVPIVGHKDLQIQCNFKESLRIVDLRDLLLLGLK